MKRLAGNSRSTKVALLLLVGLGAAVAVWFLSHRTPSGLETGDSSRPDEPRSGGSPGGDRPPSTGMDRRTNPPSSTGLPALPSVPSPSAPAIDVTVTGHVSHHGDRTPAPSVDVIFARDNAEWTATSDLEGSYSIVLGPGTYRVRALGDRVMAVDLPPLTVAREPATYDVTVVQQAVIRGRAVYRDGGAARGAIVVPQTDLRSAALLSASGELGSAEVQPDGSFELFTLQGNLVLHASDGEAAGVVAVMALKAGEQRGNVKIVLVPNGVVAGVVHTPTGRPVAGATVLASVQIPGTGEYDRVPLTADQSGRFEWQVPRPGHTIVEAEAEGFAPSAPQDFTLAPGEDRDNLVLTLLPATHSLAGHVVDAQGEPLAQVEVAQGQEGSKARYRKVFTDANGRFEITDLGPGPHRLRARKPGYQQTRERQIMAPATNITIVMPLDPGGTPTP